MRFNSKGFLEYSPVFAEPVSQAEVNLCSSVSQSFETSPFYPNLKDLLGSLVLSALQTSCVSSLGPFAASCLASQDSCPGLQTIPHIATRLSENKFSHLLGSLPEQAYHFQIFHHQRHQQPNDAILPSLHLRTSVTLQHILYQVLLLFQLPDFHFSGKSLHSSHRLTKL